MSAVAALERASSGQMRIQSLGRNSQRRTPVANSNAAQCSIGTRPRLIQLPTVCTVSPSSRATAVRPPEDSTACLSVDMQLLHSMLNPSVNTPCHDFGGDLVTISGMNQRPIDRALAWAKERRWNQSDLARAVNASPQDVTNWKKRGLPAEWHEPVARALGRSVDELLGGEGVQPPSPVLEELAELKRWKKTLSVAAQLAGPTEMTPAEFLHFVDLMAARNREDSADHPDKMVQQLVAFVAKQEMP